MASRIAGRKIPRGVDNAAVGGFGSQSTTAPAFLAAGARAVVMRGVFSALFLAALLLAVPAAQAQNNAEVETLVRKIDRLQSDLNDLQRKVYGGEVPLPQPGSGDERTAGTSERDSGLSPAAAARLQERLSGIEGDVQRLTGGLEEVQHTVRTLKKRMDKLVADVDLRLRDIESRLDAQDEAEAQRQAENGGGSGGETAANERQAAAGSEASEKDVGQENEDGGESVAGREPKTLGQVSADAVADLQGEAESKASESQQSTASSTASGGDDAEGESGGDNGDVRAAYKDAFDLLRQADYDAAETELRAFVKAHPEHTLAGNAKYWLGETFYVRENYEQAAVVFAEGFQTYSGSRKAPDNLLKLGMSLARIDRVEDACGIFSELPERFPDAAQNILQRAERERDRLECDG